MLNSQGFAAASSAPRLRTTHLRHILETKSHRGPISIASSEPILHAVDRMCEARVGALLVMEGSRPVGVVSERDLMTRVLLKRRDPATTRVADVMTADVVAVSCDASPEEVMAIMTERRCRHLPVIEDDAIVGIVSIGDVVRWASESQEFQIRMLEDYIIGKYPG